MFELIGRILEGRKTVVHDYPSAMVPAVEMNGYPFDFDGSLSYVRPKTGRDYFPTVGGDGTIAQIGAVSGFMMQRDASVWAGMTARFPSGPGSTTNPLNLQWQITVPGLSKVT